MIKVGIDSVSPGNSSKTCILKTTAFEHMSREVEKCFAKSTMWRKKKARERRNALQSPLPPLTNICMQPRHVACVLVYVHVTVEYLLWMYCIDVYTAGTRLKCVDVVVCGPVQCQCFSTPEANFKVVWTEIHIISLSASGKENSCEEDLQSSIYLLWRRWYEENTKTAFCWHSTVLSCLYYCSHDVFT